MAFRLFGMFFMANVTAIEGRFLLSRSPLKNPLISYVFHAFILFFIAENRFLQHCLYRHCEILSTFALV